ncbi:hypothetical protein ACJO1P_03765 [Vibrio parahaemolyticus]|nr:hypothetical protein [Vibrio sp. Vb0587]MDW1966031.1 hypothetical protein [Vibrio sp. Vb0587]
MRVEKNIPYQLSVDFDELFDRLEAGETIAGFYDKQFTASEYVHRDVCQLEMKEGIINGGVRGLGCLHLSEFDVKLYNAKNKNNPVNLKSLFVLSCEAINLGWIKP